MTRPLGHTGTSTNVVGTSETIINPPPPPVGTQSNPSSSPSPALALTGSTILAQVSSPTHAAASITAPISQAIPSTGNLSTHRSMSYDMPSSLMQGMHTSPSIFSENVNVSLPHLFDPGVSVRPNNH